MGKKSKAIILLEEFAELQKRNYNSHLFFGSLVRNREDMFSRGIDTIFKRIIHGKHGGAMFAELIDVALKNATEMHERRNYPSYQPLKNNLKSESSIIVEREKTIKVGKTKGQQKRRPDFLASMKNGYYLGMEIKVDTTDSRGQIAKYIKYLKDFDKGKGSYRAVLLYVTMDGAMPDDHTDEIQDDDFKRVLPISWSGLVDTTERYLKKVGKNCKDFDAEMRFLDYIRKYACQEVAEKTFTWVMDNIHALDKQWEVMSKAEEAEDTFLQLQNAILNILTTIYGYIDTVIRKNMPDSIEFDDLRPKTLTFGYFSNPSFFESEWVNSKKNYKADYYYHFTDNAEKKPSPPQALAALIERDPMIYLVARYSQSAKKLRDALGKKLGESRSGSLPRWGFGHVVRSSIFVKFTKNELKNNYPFSSNVNENPKRTEQMKQFWRDHKKILDCITEF